MGCHLRASDLIVDGIDIGILDHGVKRLEDAVTQQRGTNSVREVMKRFERAIELRLSIVIRIVGTEHTDENLFE